MKASVVIPCHPRNRPQLPRTLESLERARIRAAEAGGFAPDEVEFVVVEDAEGRGPSWARNRGLERATGEYVFFCDADDRVAPDFLAAPLAELERTEGVDICLFSGRGEIMRSPRMCVTSDEVRRTYLPAFFGYSNVDVRRWNAGGRLDLHKEAGSVCLAAFRRRFLERHTLRFDVRMTFFEDAAFLSNCMAFAEKVVTIPDELYFYEPHPDGNLASGWRKRRHWDYKFVSLDFRRRLDAQCGGTLWTFCEASCVFSALELLKARYRLQEYLDEPRVREALDAFPISLRHPLVALAVVYLRLRARRRK